MKLVRGIPARSRLEGEPGRDRPGSPNPAHLQVSLIGLHLNYWVEV